MAKYFLCSCVVYCAYDMDRVSAINQYYYNLKYLGVLLDNKLRWKPHVKKVKTQLSTACGVLSKLKHCTTQSVLKVVCNS